MKRFLFIALLFLFFLGLTNAQNSRLLSFYGLTETAGTYTSISATGTEIIFSNTDDGEQNLDLAGSFSFNYDGTAYSTFRISPNGAFVLGATTGDIVAANSINGSLKNVIAPYWDDMKFAVGTGHIFQEVSGVAGSQILTIEWNNVFQYFDDGENVSFQAKLYEADGKIEFVYGNMSAAIDWDNESGSIGFNKIGGFVSVTPGNPAIMSTVAENDTIKAPVVAAIASGTTYTFSYTTPTTPLFSVTPESYDFPLTEINTSSATQDFVVKNVGLDGLTITASTDVVISGADATYFSVATEETYPISLNFDETAMFTVTYTPTAEGTHTASLDITDGEGTHSIALGGECYDPILTPEFIESFNTYPALNWTETKGLLITTTTTTGTSSAWVDDGFANNGSTGSARINVYGTTRNDWFISPPINLDGAGGDCQLEFDIALTDYSSQGADEMGSDDKVAVVISTDNGTTWLSANILKQWTSSDPAIATAGEHIVISLVGYTGLVKLGFYAESTVSNKDYNIYFDNIKVRLIPTTPIFEMTPSSHDYGTVLLTETEEQKFIVKNTGIGTVTIAEANIVLTGANADQFSISTNTSFPITLNNMETDTITVIYNPTMEGAHVATLEVTDDASTTLIATLTANGFDATLYPPFTETFDAYPVSDYWGEMRGTLADPVVIEDALSSSWIEDGFANNGSTGSARMEVWSSGKKEWFTTPTIDLGAAGSNWQLEFDIALTYWNSTNADVLGDDDKVAVVISTDNGATWTSINTLKSWTSANTISNTGEHVIISLATYSGLVKLGFYAESTVSGGDVNVYIDNLEVQAIPTIPVFTLNPISYDYGSNEIFTNTEKEFIVSNVGIGTITINALSDIVLTGANTDQFSISTNASFPIVLNNMETDTIKVTYSPTGAGTHVATLEITDAASTTLSSTLTGECFDPTLYPPFVEAFDTYPPTNWTEMRGILADPVIIDDASSSAWVSDGFGNNGSSGSARMEIWSTSKKEWFITAPIDLGATGSNWQLEFDVALTNYYSTNADVLGADDKVAVVISTDNGITWSSVNTLKLWTSANVISNTGDHITIPLATYTGRIKLGFYAESTISGGDVSIYFDNIEVSAMPTIPIFTISETAIDYGEKQIGMTYNQDIIISNVGVGTITINDGDIAVTGTDAAMFLFGVEDDYPVILNAGENTTITVKYTPATEAVHSATLTLNDNLTKATHTVTLTGTGVDNTIIPNYTQDFEGAMFPPSGWTAINAIKGTESHNGSGCVEFPYNHTGEASLTTPVVDFSIGACTAKFWWKDDDIDNSKIATHDTTFFEILPQDASIWVTLDTLSDNVHDSNAPYVEAVHDLSAYSGQKVHLRWRDVTDGSFSAYGTGLDDFTITLNPVSVNNISDKVKIYPNPINNILNIETNSIYTISITDISGKEIIKMKSNSNKTQIDMSKYANGVYFVKLSNSNGNIVKQFVKQ